MNTYLTPRNIFALLLLCVSVLFYFNFVTPFKLDYVDNVVLEHEDLLVAYNKAKDQLSLEGLKRKKDSLSMQELNVLENYIPSRLKSGTFVYNLAQFANQNRLILKSIQYAISDETIEQLEVKKTDKRLIVDFVLEGRYEDFAKWISAIENANTLVSVESVRGVKNSAFSDIITFNVKLVVYAIDID